jgi:hypothetical protein
MIPVMKAIVEVAEAFERLPNDAAGVAAQLTIDGYKGRRRSNDACPLAHYVNHRLAAAGLDASFAANADAFELSGGGPGWSVLWDTPAHLVKFITDFDNGEYPGLVEEPEAA